MLRRAAAGCARGTRLFPAIRDREGQHHPDGRRFAKPTRSVTKFAILFRNDGASDLQMYEAAFAFGVMLMMFSPDVQATERGVVLKTLMNGFAQHGEQSQSV
jgi:hypothetical protein